MTDEPDDDAADQPSTAVDAGDEAGVKKQRISKKFKESRAVGWWRMALSTVDGRRELYRLLGECGAFRISFPAGPNGAPDPGAHQYFAGRRDLGLQFFHEWMLHDREGVLTMLDENDPTYIARKKGQ